jgi:hypothetical protein
VIVKVGPPKPKDKTQDPATGTDTGTPPGGTDAGPTA